MITITTREAVRHAAKYLKGASSGATFLVTRRGAPASVIMPAGDHGSRYQAADPIVNPPVMVCYICESADGCAHATARCRICGEVGLRENMRDDLHGLHCPGAR